MSNYAEATRIAIQHTTTVNTVVDFSEIQRRSRTSPNDGELVTSPPPYCNPTVESMSKTRDMSLLMRNGQRGTGTERYMSSEKSMAVLVWPTFDRLKLWQMDTYIMVGVSKTERLTSGDLASWKVAGTISIPFIGAQDVEIGQTLHGRPPIDESDFATMRSCALSAKFCDADTMCALPMLEPWDESHMRELLNDIMEKRNAMHADQTLQRDVPPPMPRVTDVKLTELTNRRMALVYGTERHDRKKKYGWLFSFPIIYNSIAKLLYTPPANHAEFTLALIRLDGALRQILRNTCVGVALSRAEPKQTMYIDVQFNTCVA